MENRATERKSILAAQPKAFIIWLQMFFFFFFFGTPSRKTGLFTLSEMFFLVCCGHARSESWCMWEIRLKPLYSYDLVGWQEPFRDKLSWCSFSLSLSPSFCQQNSWFSLCPASFQRLSANVGLQSSFPRRSCFYPSSGLPSLTVHALVFGAQVSVVLSMCVSTRVS